jgi:hypothetical protein
MKITKKRLEFVMKLTSVSLSIEDACIFAFLISIFASDNDTISTFF